MKEYYIRRTGVRHYEIAVFDGHKAPDVVYFVHHGSCDCPARGNCKHLKLLQLFKELREPWCTMFWQENEEWRWISR